MGVDAERLSLIVFAVSGATGEFGRRRDRAHRAGQLGRRDIPTASRDFCGVLSASYRSPTVAVLGGLGIGVVGSLAAGYSSSGWKDFVVYGVMLAYLLIRGCVPCAAGPVWSRYDARARFRSAIAGVIFVLAVALYPLLWSDSYHVGIGIAAGTLAISAVGMVLLIGFAEQLAIGQPAFSMIGGYANALLCVNYGWDPFVAMVLGAATSMAVAYVIGAPILKLRGFALAMATLALQLMLIVFANQVGFTGGPMGVTGLSKFAVFGLEMTRGTARSSISSGSSFSSRCGSGSTSTVRASAARSGRSPPARRRPGRLPSASPATRCRCS